MHLLAAALAAVFATLLAGCGPTTAPQVVQPVATERPTEGEPRAYRMGFSALPSTLTDEGYEAAFDLAASQGEVLLFGRPIRNDPMLYRAIGVVPDGDRLYPRLTARPSARERRRG